MDLKGGYPYQAVKNGLMYALPQLGVDLNCDLAVVGANISGALIAEELAGHGPAVAVLGAGLPRVHIERRPHPLITLFSLARLGSQ